MANNFRFKKGELVQRINGSRLFVVDRLKEGNTNLYALFAERESLDQRKWIKHIPENSLIPVKEIALSPGLQILRRQMVAESRKFRTALEGKAQEFGKKADCKAAQAALEFMAISKFLEKTADKITPRKIRIWAEEQKERFGIEI